MSPNGDGRGRAGILRLGDPCYPRCTMSRIAVVDDEKNIRETVRLALEREGHASTSTPTARTPGPPSAAAFPTSSSSTS